MNPPPAPSRPRLRPGTRLTHDTTRGADIALLPETVLVLNDTASAVLALCDGTRTVDDIVTLLGQRYTHVPRHDVDELLTRLAQARVIADE